MFFWLQTKPKTSGKSHEPLCRGSGKAARGRCGWGAEFKADRKVRQRETSDITVVLRKHSGLLWGENVNLNSELPNNHQGFHLSLQKHILQNKNVSSYPDISYLLPVQNCARATPPFNNVIKVVSLCFVNKFICIILLLLFFPPDRRALAKPWYRKMGLA